MERKLEFMFTFLLYVGETCYTYNATSYHNDTETNVTFFFDITKPMAA